MADQKLKFRDELENFAERSFGTSMAKLNDKQRSDALVLCYLMTIRNALLPGSIPDELDELQSYICDGKSDRMVDFLYRDDNNHVTIIQAKHRAPSRGETEAEFEAFKSCLKLLCPDTRPKTQINQKLLDVMSDIDRDTDSFTLIYLSLARHSEPIANSAEADLADIPNSSLKDISSRSELLYLSEDELNKEWRDVIGQRAGSSPTVEIRLSQPGKNEESEHPYLLFENPNGIRSYVGLLSAQQIHQLYNRYRVT